MSTCQGHRFGRLSLVALIVLALGGAVSALAVGGGGSLSEAVNTDRTGLAVSGYDPVAYFTAGVPTRGDFQITAEHDGAVYRFASEENRDRFLENPERYAPQYGGYCAYGVAVDKKFSADPTVWKIKNDRLYLNLDRNIAKLFEKDVAGHIKNADENWKSLAEKPAR